MALCLEGRPKTSYFALTIEIQEMMFEDRGVRIHQGKSFTGPSRNLLLKTCWRLDAAADDIGL